jgi:hypothetical protein
MAPAAYGGIGLPTQGGAVVMPPLLGLPAGMAAMQHSMAAAAAGRGTPALQQAGSLHTLGTALPPPAMQQKQPRQRPGSAQGAAADGRDNLQIAEAPQADPAEARGAKRQRLGGT